METVAKLRRSDATPAIPGRRSWAVLLTGTMLLLCTWAGEAGAFRNVAPGAAAPPISLSDTAGAAKNTADLAGKAKLIAFVSGNDRSKKVLEELEPLYQEFKGDGLEVLAVYVGSDRAEAKTMAETAKITFPLLLDTDRSVYGAWGIAVTPVMAFIAKDDKLLKEQSYVPLLKGILEVEAKVAVGKMTREQADLALRPEEAPQVSTEEKVADKEYNLGLVLLERGMKDKAVEKFKKVLEIDPTYCKVRLQLGQLYLGDNKVDEAKAEFDYVLKCDPTSHEAKVGMGTVLGIKGDLDKGIEIIQSALQLNPKAELAYYELGKLFEKKGQLDKAVENYKKALEKLLSK